MTDGYDSAAHGFYIDAERAVAGPEKDPIARPVPPIPTTVPKRERTRLLKAELLGHVAAGVAHAADLVADGGLLDADSPRDQVPPVDVRRLCITYGLSPDDVRRALRSIQSSLELEAAHRGYADRWTR